MPNTPLDASLSDDGTADADPLIIAEMDLGPPPRPPRAYQDTKDVLEHVNWVSVFRGRFFASHYPEGIADYVLMTPLD